MRPKRHRDGYAIATLTVLGKRKFVQLHRITWSAFHGPIPDGMVINHKNGIKNDNRLANLEVVTKSENTAHGYRVLGRKAPNYPSFGEKNGSAKLTEERVRKIRQLYATGKYRQKDIAIMFGVTQRLICIITRREIWSHVE